MRSDGEGPETQRPRSSPSARDLDRALRNPRVLTALLALGASMPVLVLAVRAVAAGWYPVADDAVITLRSFDVFSTRSPTVGQFTLAGQAIGVDTYSPGPLGYWLLALPVRILPLPWLPLVVAAWHTTMISSSIVLARRLGGLVFATILAFVVAAATSAWDPYTFVSPWNPYLPITAVLLLFFLAWGCLQGRAWLLPAATFVASFLVQNHAVFGTVTLLWSLAALAGVVAGLGARARRDGHAGDRESEVDPAASATGDQAVPDAGRGWRRWWAPVPVSVLVALVVWSLPLADQVAGRGNLANVLRSGRSGGPGAGARLFWGSLDRTLSLRPVWTRRPNPNFAGFWGHEAPAGATLRPGSWLVLAGVVAVVGLAIRRRDRVLLRAAGLVLAGIAAVGATALEFPRANLLTVKYLTGWYVVVGILVWALFALAVLRSLPPAARRRTRPIARFAPLVLLVGAVSGAAVTQSPQVAAGRGAPALGDVVRAATRPGGRYRVGSEDGLRSVADFDVVMELRLAGRNPVVAPGGPIGPASFGDAYAPAGRRCDGIFVLVPADAAGSDVVGRVEVADQLDMVVTDTAVTLTPDRSPTGRC